MEMPENDLKELNESIKADVGNGVSKPGEWDLPKPERRPLDWGFLASVFSAVCIVLIMIVGFMFYWGLSDNQINSAEQSISTTSWNGLLVDVNQLKFGEAVLSSQIQYNIELDQNLHLKVNALLEAQSNALFFSQCQLAQNDVNSIWVCPKVK